MKKIILLLSFFINYFYCQDISDFLPFDFDKVSIEDLKVLKSNCRELVEDYAKRNNNYKEKTDSAIKLLEDILNVEYTNSLDKKRIAIFNVLDTIQSDREYQNLLEDINSEFSKQELNYKLRFASRIEVGNNDQVILNSLSPSFTFNMFYVFKENKKFYKKQTKSKNLVEVIEPFWVSLGLTLNFNIQSNSSKDTSSVISKILTYGNDVNIYPTLKCGWNFKRIKFLLGLNTGLSYIRDKNIEPSVLEANIVNKITPSSSLFLNANGGIWFFDLFMIGIKAEKSFLLNDVVNKEEESILTNVKGKLFSILKIPVLNLGLVLSYLIRTNETVPFKERFQFKFVQSFDIGM